MNFTKRNHYNPCFWTALWNDEYFDLAISGGGKQRRARQQSVHALSVKSGRVFRTTVDGIHYDKKMGIAEITRDSAAEFVRRNHPEQYNDFLLNNECADYPVFIDFEDILTALEGLPPYQALMKTALSGTIEGLEQQTNIGAFIVLQCLRSHAVMNSMVDWSNELGYAKFEYFINLKWMLSDPQSLFDLVNPLVCGRWTLFTSPPQPLPLCDSAILVGPKSVMVALSPRLLLEIEPNAKTLEYTSPNYQEMPDDKFEEFRCRTIGNTFREIIGQKDVLEQWGLSEEFCSRARLMKSVGSYNSIVHKSGEHELWQLNAYGNRR